jgi:hypothetical protein
MLIEKRTRGNTNTKTNNNNNNLHTKINISPGNILNNKINKFIFSLLFENSLSKINDKRTEKNFANQKYLAKD